ncbi:MAG: hypothetical protein ACK5KT_17060 [Dysgonomonas sp.]
MTPIELAIREKLLRGIHISYNKFLAEKQAQDGELYFSRNGKVVGIKARDLNPVDINTHIR